jgi:hypothetical protein
LDYVRGNAAGQAEQDNSPNRKDTEEILEKVKENENKAMEKLSEDEHETLMSLTKKYVTCFKGVILKG